MHTALTNPPYLSLPEALKVAEDIQHQGGGTLTRESLASVLGNSPKSSSFRLKASALKSFGLVDKQAGKITLTQLGLAYAKPVTDHERGGAATEAFRRVPLARELHDRYAGGVLPSVEVLGNVILREYNAAEPLNVRWAEFFLAGLRAADLIHTVSGRSIVRLKPEDTTQSTPALLDLKRANEEVSAEIMVERSNTGASSERIPLDPSRSVHQRVELPLQDGTFAAIILPRAASPDDIDDVIALLEVMKRRASRSQV